METNGNREPLRLVSYRPGDIWCEEYKVKRDASRSHFYVPVFEFPEIEERVLNEDWNLKDILHSGKYRTFLEANVDVYAKIIKVTHSDGKYVWICAVDWQYDSIYRDARISEMMLKPYFYTDEYGRNMIAGQLKFMELKVDIPTTQNNTMLSNKIDVDVDVKSGAAVATTECETVPNAANTQLVNVIKALGLTPKEAIKILIEEV